MKVVIKYAKQDSKGKIRLIDGFIYTAELRSNNVKTITKEINSIYDDYKGDYLEQYMEPKANVFCCYLLAEGDEIKPEKFVFKSDIAKKKDPIAILDGLVRRMKVDKISMSDGKFTQAFEGLKVDERDEEDLIAKKYIYEDLLSKEDVTTGKNIRFMLPYRDTEKISDDNYSFNQRMVNNCIPFCFLLEGEIVSNITSCEVIEFPDYTITETNTQTTKYRLDLKKQKVILDDKVLWLLNGEIKTTNDKEEDYFKNITPLIEGLDDGVTIAVGLFYSCLKAGENNVQKEEENIVYKANDSDELRAENYEVLKINPWYSYIAEKNSAVIKRSRLEEMIANGKYVDTDPFAEFAKDIHKQIVKKLKTYGLKLFEPSKDGRKKSDNLIMLSRKQSRKILDTYEKPRSDPSYVVKRIDTAAWNYLKNGKICEKDTESFTDELCKSNVTIKTDGFGNLIPPEYSFANFRTAVHEVGHAIAVRQLFGKYSLNKITIISDDKWGGFVSSERGNVNIDSFYDKRICVCLASKIAEELFFGVAERGWIQDMQNALGILIFIIKNYATFDMENGRICCYLNRTDAIPADDAIDVLMDQYMEKTRKMLADKKDLILELAGNMMIEQEVSGERFEEMCAFYEEKQNVRKDRELCEKLHFVIETSMQYNRDKETSKAFINLLTTPGKEIIFHKMFKYHPEIDPGCGAVSMINAMLGYNLFSKDGLKPISSKLSEYGGAIGLVVDKDGKNFAVFIDGSDRTGRGEGIRLIHGKKRGKFVKYDTIDTATKLIYAGENGSCCKTDS